MTAYAESNFPELIIPWLNSGKQGKEEVLDQMLQLAEQKTETSSDEEEEMENDKEEKKNFDHLYVYKTTTKRKSEEFMKFIPTERKEDSKQYEESNAYISANLGRVQSNTGRVSKKIKKKKIV